MVATLAAAAGAFTLARGRLLAREVVFDWRAREIAWTLGRRVERRPLGSIRRVALTDTSWGSGHGPSGKSQFGCRLDVSLGGEDVFVVETETWDTEEGAAARRFRPLAAALAGTLGVAWTEGT